MTNNQVGAATLRAKRLVSRKANDEKNAELASIGTSKTSQHSVSAVHIKMEHPGLPKRQR